jgi:hypothetical protein
LIISEWEQAREPNPSRLNKNNQIVIFVVSVDQSDTGKAEVAISRPGHNCLSLPIKGKTRNSGKN